MVRALIVGTGAIGGLYSSRLAKTCNITAVCRSNYNAVLQDGFRIESPKFGKYTFRPNKVTKCVEDAVSFSESTPFNYIVVALKSLPEVYSVADIIAPAVSPETTVVLIQNGLGIEEPVVKRFPQNSLVSIVSYIGCSQSEPGRITMSGKEESLTVGPYLQSGIDSSRQCRELAGLFEQGNVQVQVVDDIEKVRWKKLFWNASFSSVCTITGLDTSQVLEIEEKRVLLDSVMREVIQVANAMGYEFDEEEQVSDMLDRTRRIAQFYKPSMLLDKERNQPLEVEAILGAPLRKAQEKGMAVPNLLSVYNQVSAINPVAKSSRK